MDIDQACRTIRRANDSFLVDGIPGDAAVDVPEAVAVLRNWLEGVRGDGKRIEELMISPSLLVTPAGIRWVMNYVTSAETLAAAARRRANAN
jgi:hypothetical protein